MSNNTCRYWPCDNPTRNDATGYAGSFCSTKHELKYEHIKADAQDAAVYEEQ